MLGKALKLIRSYYDLSQTELCSRLGISNSHLSEIESGKKQPSIELLRKYSDYFEIPLSSILFFF
jgi:transcriptional regulator with XRE-family HTH domain